MAAPARPRGRGLLLVLRVAAVATSLLFVALFVTTLLMVTPGSLELVPPGEDATFRFEEGVLFIDTSFQVGNRAYHDLTNLTFFVRAEMAGVGLLADYRTPPVDVAVGEQRTMDLSIPLSLAPLVESGLLVLQPAHVTFTMGLGGTTTRNLLDFAGAFTFQDSLGPLVDPVEVDFDNSTLTLENGTYVWDVPYRVGTAPFLTGSATAHVSVFNETGGLLAETTETLPLGEAVEDELTFVLTEEAAQDLDTDQTLTVRAELTLPGDLTFVLEWEVAWSPPAGGDG